MRIGRGGKKNEIGEIGKRGEEWEGYGDSNSKESMRVAVERVGVGRGMEREKGVLKSIGKGVRDASRVRIMLRGGVKGSASVREARKTRGKIGKKGRGGGDRWNGSGDGRNGCIDVGDYREGEDEMWSGKGGVLRGKGTSRGWRKGFWWR